MSTARGNSNRNRPQKHQNRTVFKNDLHDTSHRTKLINSLQINGVCQRCKDILDWKIKYKKYKPLTAPRKCVGCDQKTVKHAYHMLCTPCAKQKNVCAKCCKAAEVRVHCIHRIGLVPTYLCRKVKHMMLNNPVSMAELHCHCCHWMVE